MKDKKQKPRRKIEIPWYSVLFLALIFLYGGGRWQVSLLLAALLHEAGHLLAAWICGVRIERMTLYPFGIDIVPAARPLRSYGTDLLLAGAGAGVNLLTALISLGLSGAAEVTACHFGMAAVNLLPIRGLDGGTLLDLVCRRFLSPMRAELTVRIFSFLLLFLLWLIAVYSLLMTTADPSLFVLVCFLFASIFLSRQEIGG